MNIENLIEALRTSPVFDTTTVGNEAADAIEALASTATEYQQAADKMAMDHKVERDTLRQQLAEAQALIETCRKQEPVAWLITAAGTKRQEVQLCKPYRLLTSERVRPLYAAPVVAPAVLKDAERYRWLRRPDNTSLDTWLLTFSNEKLDAAIDAAMGDAND